MIEYTRSLRRTVLVAASTMLISVYACLAHSQDANVLSALPPDSAIQALMADRMERNGVGMVVGVIDSAGARVFSTGRSGADDDRPLDGDTVFQIGSVTKTVTTLLLADMVLRGEVGLDDSAEGYLPDGVTLPRKGRPITLRDLATHRSGLPSMPEFDIHGDPNPYESYSVDDLYEFLSSYELEDEPGTNEAYSNLGVALLGRLLANRAGTEYEALIKKRVLDPLGMKDTSIMLNEDQRRRLAPGHDRYLHPVDTWEMATLPASGSLRSTANDILRFLAAYLGYTETPLSSAMDLQLSEELGWGVRSTGIVLHAGGKEGYRSAVAFNPDTGLGAVVLTNARTYDEPMRIALHIVAGEDLPPAPLAPDDKRRIELPPEVLNSYEGHYASNTGEFEVARNGSRLLIRYPSGAILEFVSMAPHEFFFDGGNDDVEFELDSQGRVSALLVYGDGKDAGEVDRYPRLD